MLRKSTGQSIPYREVIDGIETFHPTYYFTPRFLKPLYGFFCFISIFFTATRLIKSKRPNCIFATWAYPDGFAAAILGGVYNIPVYIKVHGSDIHGINNWLVGKLTAWGLKRTKKVFSVSNNLNNMVICLGVATNKILTIYNGLDHTIFFPQDKIVARNKFGIPLDKTVLLYVGNLERVKGTDVLLEAFKLINSKKSNIVLYIIGKGRLLKELQGQCETGNIDSNTVVFTGPVAHETMAQWMNIADLLVVPSRDEGVPNVILEAMACQIPVVATRVGGIPEVVVENTTGLLVEPECPEKLALSIQEALTKEWNKEAISKEAQKYSWEKNVSQIIECIQKGCDES